MPKNPCWNRLRGFVKVGGTGQNRQNAEKILHGPGRIDVQTKVVKKPRKALTIRVLACILKQYHKNGIERPKGILPKSKNQKLCEKRRIWLVSRAGLWDAFANFVNLWNRSGRVLW